MSVPTLENDERFRKEVERVQRLFFILLPITLLAIAAVWAMGEGVTGKELAANAGHAVSSVSGTFSGGTD